MTRYVAFLRGINVGGHNTIKKETLQEAFTALGFKAVATFKQSGNIIFETDIQDPEAIRKAIQQKLNQLLSGSTAVFLRTVPQLAEIIMNSPFKNAAEEGASYWVTFMSEKQLSSSAPITIPKSTAEITLVKDFEAYSVTRGHGDGGKPNPYTESKFKTQATTRNLNIIREITEVYS
jgi:uncharacterized protein (DUF1697 family)